MTQITSRQNPRIKELISIKNMPKDTLLIEGLHLIKMAYDAKLILELFCVKPLNYDVSMTLISEEVADKLSDKKSNDGHFALIKKPDFSFDLTKNLLYLDEVNDPGNLGTLMRTALAFNFGGIILSPKSVSPYNNKVLSAAQGAHFRLPIKNLNYESLVRYKEEGYQIIVTTLENALSIEEVPSGKKILVLGNEARGVSKEVKKIADYNVKIPIKGIESLNVAVAGAILMYEINKTR